MVGPIAVGAAIVVLSTTGGLRGCSSGGKPDFTPRVGDCIALTQYIFNGKVTEGYVHKVIAISDDEERARLVQMTIPDTHNTGWYRHTGTESLPLNGRVWTTINCPDRR